MAGVLTMWEEDKIRHSQWLIYNGKQTTIASRVSYLLTSDFTHRHTSTKIATNKYLSINVLAEHQIQPKENLWNKQTARFKTIGYYFSKR